MKKLAWILVLVFLAVATLVSCGNSVTTTEAPSTTTEPAGSTTADPPTTEAPPTPEQPASEGLIYRLNGDKTGYIVLGYGNCTDTDVIIPKTYQGIPVVKIGEEAFLECKYLYSITIPDSVTSIGDSAFRGCNNLKYNEYKNGKYLGNAQNPYVVLVDTITTDFSSFEIASTTKLIGDYAFYDCTSLTSITIPDSVTSIGDYAFSDCSSLTSITIPDSVTSIGNKAFSGCTGLTSITVASDNTVYYSKGNCIIEKGTNTLVVGCKTSVIPDSVTSIGEYAFSGCTGLTSITIPDSVTSIGNWAFDECSNLTIYCEAASKPAGWSDSWNPINRRVVWGYKG